MTLSNRDSYICQRRFILDSTVRSNHAILVETLPGIHKDPFDRLLVAQAIADDLTLVTADAHLARYPVKILW
jgi:PIN domain nuclease of toxin-antitoxin system